MKIVALMGSHRSNGNTRQVLDWFLSQIEAGNTLTFYDVNQVHVEHCLACDYCITNPGECIITEDDMGAIHESLLEADLIVLASPVYFTAFPSKLKKIFDRVQVLHEQRKHQPAKAKKFVGIFVGGAPAYKEQFLGIEYTLEWIKRYYNAESLGSVGFAHTDELPAMDNIKSLAELGRLVEKVLK